jgi:hypothetical protein
LPVIRKQRHEARSGWSLSRPMTSTPTSQAMPVPITDRCDKRWGGTVPSHSPRGAR